MSSNGRSWGDFAGASPALAADLRRLLEEAGVACLATIRADGGPRVHPVSPVVADDGLFCFVGPSPKRRDLTRDGRFALQACTRGAPVEEAYLAGRARPVTDGQVLHRVVQTGRATSGDWPLFELVIEVAMVTARPAGLDRASHRIWHASGRRFDLFDL